MFIIVLLSGIISFSITYCRGTDSRAVGLLIRYFYLLHALKKQIPDVSRPRPPVSLYFRVSEAQASIFHLLISSQPGGDIQCLCMCDIGVGIEAGPAQTLWLNVPCKRSACLVFVLEENSPVPYMIQAARKLRVHITGYL